MIPPMMKRRLSRRKLLILITIIVGAGASPPAPRHEVHEEITAGLCVLSKRVGKGRSRLDVLLHLQEDLLEVRVGLLGREDIETLDEGKAGIDHRGELPGEDHELLHADLRPERDVAEGEGPPLGFYLDRHELLPAKVRDHGRVVWRLILPLANHSLPVLRFVREKWHRCFLPRATRRSGGRFCSTLAWRC